MSDAINLEKIAELAYLNLSEEDKKRLLPKVQKVIDYMGKIQKLQLDNKQEDFLTNRKRFREDKVVTHKINIATLSKFSEENCFIVPKVIENIE